MNYNGKKIYEICFVYSIIRFLKFVKNFMKLDEKPCVKTVKSSKIMRK